MSPYGSRPGNSPDGREFLQRAPAGPGPSVAERAPVAGRAGPVGAVLTFGPTGATSRTAAESRRGRLSVGAPQKRGAVLLWSAPGGLRQDSGRGEGLVEAWVLRHPAV